MKITFPATENFQLAKRLLQTIERSGEEAYIVGGAVRDTILERQVNDIDITTSATPEKIIQLFAKTLPTGIAHGTVSVYEHDHWFEVTTYREEGPYDDGRHPRYVHFDTNLVGDLSRRDFTINAMAMDQNGELRDPFHGYDDLMARTIRAVGDAKTRFQEDGLRVARAFRFAATLGFTIAESTMVALSSSASFLDKVAAERRLEEWNKFLGALMAPLCDQLPDDIISKWTGWKDFLFSSCCHQISKAEGANDRLALIFLLTKFGAVVKLESMMRTLRYSKKNIDEVQALVQISRTWQVTSPARMTISFGKALSSYGEKLLERAVRLIVIQDASLTLDDELAHAAKWLNEHPVRTLKDLAIQGSDLIRDLSLQGPIIGMALEHLFDLVANGQLPNTYDALLKEANEWIMEAVIDEQVIRNMLQKAPKNLMLYEYKQLSSTNDVAREKMAEAKVPMLAVFTDHQESGRGRQGRAWVSPPGKGLALSVAFRLEADDMNRLQEWPLFAALTVRSALSSIGIEKAMIKWPNDIFIEGKKVCGILTEMRSVGKEVHLVIGIGINVNAELSDFPDDLKSKVTSLKITQMKSISINILTARLIDEFYELLLTYQAKKRFSDQKDEYERYCMTLGQRIHVRQGHNAVTGVATRIDEEGTLWISDDQGSDIPIRSGEIIENSEDRV